MDKIEKCIVPLIHFANIFFCDSEEECDYEHKMNFAEEIVLKMHSNQFKIHFRMHSTTFEDLKKINSVHTPNIKGHPQISIEKSLLLTLWYFANIESFRGVAVRFSVSKSTAWHAVNRICHLLLYVNRVYNIISWPSTNRATNIAAYFQRKYSIPGIIGVIDGSHIKITAPKENHTSYINRKGFHSVVLQVICDNKKLFTDVYVGEAGCVHDYTVFVRSDVSKRPNEDFPNDSHLIGDLAYKLSTKMLVGFKKMGQLTPRQNNFNTALAKARVMVENSLALLKGRFRRLKFMETLKLHLTSLLIMSACILHNICILSGDNAENLININNGVLVEYLHNHNNILDIIPDNEDRNARRKRDNIVYSIPQIREG